MNEAKTGRGWQFWAGWVLTAIPTGMLLFSASMKLGHSAEFMKGWTDGFGFPADLATTIGIVEVLCALLYVIPPTAVLGAILMTGYLGGAVCTHLRAGIPSPAPALILGVLAWGGLWGRDPRVRALLPLRR